MDSTRKPYAADILAVDDNSANLRLLEAMLHKQGYRVRCADSGKLALRSARISPPDLILLDIKMSDMDGLEVCRRFKSNLALRHIPVIFISALRETADIVRAFAAGGVDYIPKPFQLEEVRARVETHLQLRSYQRKLERYNRQLKETIGKVEDAEVALLYAGMDGALARANKVFLQLTGYQESDIGHLSLERLSHPHHRVEMRERVDKLLLGAAPQMSFEHPCARKDGSTVWFAFMLSRVETSRDLPGYLIGVIEDITERKQSEQETRLAASVFDNTSEAIMITDAQGRIQRINRAFTQITGYGEADTVGQTPSLLRSGRHDYQFFQNFWGQLARVGSWNGEIWNRRKNGELFSAWQNVTAVRDPKSGEIIRYISSFSDITEQKFNQEKLQHLAYYDALTELPNRALFIEQCKSALARARRDQHYVAVLFVDLDRFKHINESLGHPAGDELLQTMAFRLLNAVYEHDTVARQGGDEFTVLLDRVPTPKDAGTVAARLLQAVHMPVQLDGHELELSASIGISVYPGDGDSAIALIKNAYAAGYRAKSEGRDTYQFYTEELTTAAMNKVTMQASLRRAIEQRELVVYYQPQVNLQTGKIHGVEALVRWQHPAQGLLMPGRFIALAEETGQIVPLGEYVMLSACQQMRVWLDQGVELHYVSVNVAGQQIQRGDLVETVRKTLRQAKLPPRFLELEITETFIMEKAEQAISQLDQLKAEGVHLSIDDFGTGYSSLSYLKRLPIDKLKIDQSFVRDIPADSNDEAIVRAIIALGRGLDLRITAEGVETPDQKAFLVREQCQTGQGHLFSRAVPAEEITAMYRDLGQHLNAH